MRAVRQTGLAFLAAVCLQTLAGVAWAASVAPAPWQNLFADEAWYKQQAGEEQVFRGKLESVTPPQASTLMRNALYKLGDRTIYTGAKKLPALDALAGKTVEIRGKAVDMELDGQAVSEIWPAAIRPVFIRPESAAAPAPHPEEMVLTSPITIEKTSYSVLPRLSAEAGLGEKRDQAMRLLGRNGFAVIRNAAEEKVFLDRLAQAGLEAMIQKHQPAGPAPAWAGFEQGMLVVCWRDLHSSDTLRIAGAEQTADGGSGKRNTARLDLQVVRQEAGRNVPTWKACGVWLPRVARLEVPGPGKDEIWRADATWGGVADGLQASLEVTQRQIKPGDDITLTMTLRNARPAGGETLRVWDNKYSHGYRADFYLVITPDGQSRILRRPEQPAWHKNVPTPIPIEPGKSWTLAGIANDAIVKSLNALGLDTSKEGIYTITGYYEADASPDPVDPGDGFWGGQIATAPVEVRVGLALASPEADMYRAHYPHGVHKLRTDKASEKIVWDSTTLAGDEVKRETLTFANLDEFKAKFAKRGPDKAAYIEIAGVWDHAAEPATNAQQNEALLKFIRANGYEEAGYANLKKYYRATGHHFIDPIRADGKITWSSSRIKGDRIERVQREFASVDEFKKAFREAQLDKQTEIEVHARRVKFEGATERAQAIIEFLRAEGYTAAGGVSN